MRLRKRHFTCVLLLWLPVTTGCATTLAESGRVSWTAESVCAMRAIAARHPDPKVRNPDHLAERFVSEAYWQESAYRVDAAVTGTIADPSYFYVNARTHHIDALMIEEVERGATQVVNLGAGFDSRAYRFNERFPQIRFFELDLPATIAAKRERVRRMLGEVPDRVVLVATDFNTHPMADVLRSAGYDPAQRTFFIWEGVTMYLPEPANRATLRFIRSGSAPGSSVVYDYILDAAYREDGAGLYGARGSAIAAATRGEPFLFGWSQSGAAAYAAAHGLTVESDLGPAELTARYLIRSDGRPDGRMAEFLRIIHARIP